jgi:hypothetical protein
VTCLPVAAYLLREVRQLSLAASGGDYVQSVQVFMDGNDNVAVSRGQYRGQ